MLSDDVERARAVMAAPRWRHLPEGLPEDMERAIWLAANTMPALLDVLEAANRRRRTECSDHAVPLAWCEACGAESSARRLLATAINDAEAQLREALR
jgi:hypothetical protein